MVTAFEQITREAVQMPRHQRLALASFLMELEEPDPDPEAEAAWEAELRARAQAIQEGRCEGIPYEQVLARVDRTLAR